MPSELPPKKIARAFPLRRRFSSSCRSSRLLRSNGLFPTSFVHGGVRWTLGALFFVGRIALNIGGFMTQKHAGTDPIPFNPSTRIVAHGLYRFTCNPMYISFALWTLGLSILVDSAWMLLAVTIGLVLIDRIVITREERYLERKFGEEYLNYKRRVRRWI